MKTALITGASSGIGKEFAKIHAQAKGNLVIVARNESKLNILKADLEREHGIEVLVIAKDLTEPGAALDVFDEVKANMIKIDYLINNAGFGGHGKFHERKWEEDHSMIQLNIIALSELTRLFLPGMVERNSGKILNVSSTASLMPGPLQAVYFATKAYVTSFSNAIYEELRGSNVTITALLPGATETQFAKTAGMDKTALFSKTFSANSVAESGYKAMLKGKLNVWAGLSFGQKFMLGLIPYSPAKMVLKQVRKAQEISQ
ncbi:MAG: short-subunit dehydrogenase [Parvicellaceae bacterium]|jgi:short-subunit dehydrogenase